MYCYCIEKSEIQKIKTCHLIIHVYLRQLNITSIIFNLNFCQLPGIKENKNKILIKQQLRQLTYHSMID